MDGMSGFEDPSAERPETAADRDRRGTVLVVTSGKGGVGKSTTSAALGASLAMLGDQVVLIDFDIGLRKLDLMLGAERQVVYDLIDVIEGRSNVSQSLVEAKGIPGLWLMAASSTKDKNALTEDGVRRVVRELAARFRWVICDSPAGIEAGAKLAMLEADAAIVVVNPEVSSVRDSDRIIGLLDSDTRKAVEGVRMPKHLILTRYDDRRARGGEMMTREEVAKILDIPVLAIVGESQDVLASSNIGRPVTFAKPDGAAAHAYRTAARTLRGDREEAKRPGLLKRVFGRG